MNEETVTISRREYLALLMFRDDMAWYWKRYKEAKNKRGGYEGFMIFNQFEGAPYVNFARLAYWWQLAKDRE